MNDQNIPNPVIPSSESVSELIIKALLTELERIQKDADLCHLSVSNKEKHIAQFLKNTPGYAAIPMVVRGKIWRSIERLAPDIYQAHYRKAHPEKPRALKPKGKSTSQLAAIPVERSSEEKIFWETLNKIKEELKIAEAWGKFRRFIH